MRKLSVKEKKFFVEFIKKIDDKGLERLFDKCKLEMAKRRYIL